MNIKTVGMWLAFIYSREIKREENTFEKLNPLLYSPGWTFFCSSSLWRLIEAQGLPCVLCLTYISLALLDDVKASLLRWTPDREKPSKGSGRTTKHLKASL